ncbi:hypothetical protein M408DRAFT_240392 [Serendipita vermifera MAFF 305830]|uniref:C2H2-type domain-containing protein n=1 Tax=Serendipita vermifera MAFF 305830 TaxID=933852 RepID=A0A0C3BK79_SERVB|nr:hypothetical protein M408DRAFT_240392 [Serendipita vermifera MAFF 305830]
MSTTDISQGKGNTPIEHDPDKLYMDVHGGPLHGSVDGADAESDLDAAGDEDDEINNVQNETIQTIDEGEAVTEKNDEPVSQSMELDSVTVQARARLRSRANLKKRIPTPDELESEEDDGLPRKVRASTESEEDGEDELDSEAEQPRAHGKRGKGEPGPSTKKITSVQDLPMYAQHAYVASTYGLPKLPIPMVLLPGLRSRKPPPIPIPELTKRSRGRHVAAAEDDGRKYHCTVAGCDKRFARGEHLKRHIRSIHTHEKPHQCPYPGCLRGFSRTDNMMQHMRTHDDWPDDEAAAQLLADAEKKAGKKSTAIAGLPSDKDFNPFAPMMPFPWQMQMPPTFLKWAQQTGITPFIPFMPPPLAAGTSGKDVLPDDMDLDAELALSDPAATTTNEETPAQPELVGTAETGTLEPESADSPSKIDNESSTISPNLTTLSTATSQDTPTKGKKTPTKSKHKTSRGTSKSTAPSSSVPNSPTEGVSDVAMDISMSAGMMNPLLSGMGMGMGMGAWGMPPGMQFPFMPMPPQMGPAGVPFPPPAIAIPIPVGTPLPHPSQLPPNAQLIPDAKGGHTIIIPPPPSPWGMPFPPGMLPMPMPMPPPSSTPTSPTLDSNTAKSPSV